MEANSKSLCLALVAVAALSAALAASNKPSSKVDHLVPADILFDLKDATGTAYRERIERKLYVTPGELARFIQMPGGANPETLVSLYRSGKNGHKYMVTCTQASSSLWETVQPSEGRAAATNAVNVRVRRCDAELPASLALAIHRIWLTMLTDVRPEPTPPGVVYLHGTAEIFTAVDAANRELRGRRPPEYSSKGKVSDLISLAFLLQAYCDPPPEGRDVVAKELAKAVREFPIGRTERGEKRGVSKD